MYSQLFHICFVVGPAALESHLISLTLHWNISGRTCSLGGGWLLLPASWIWHQGVGWLLDLFWKYHWASHQLWCQGPRRFRVNILSENGCMRMGASLLTWLRSSVSCFCGPEELKEEDEVSVQGGCAVSGAAWHVSGFLSNFSWRGSTAKMAESHCQGDLMSPWWVLWNT